MQDHNPDTRVAAAMRRTDGCRLFGLIGRRTGRAARGRELHQRSDDTEGDSAAGDGAPCTSRHATYDLRRMRRKQVIERLPGTHRYRLTPHGRAIAVLFTKAYGRILTPGLTALGTALPSELTRRPPLASAWRELDHALGQHITAGLAAA